MMQIVERIILKVLFRVGVDGKVEKIGVTVSKNPAWAQKWLFLYKKNVYTFTVYINRHIHTCYGASINGKWAIWALHTIASTPL